MGMINYTVWQNVALVNQNIKLVHTYAGIALSLKECWDHKPGPVGLRSVLTGTRLRLCVCETRQTAHALSTVNIIVNHQMAAFLLLDSRLDTRLPLVHVGMFCHFSDVTQSSGSLGIIIVRSCKCVRVLSPAGGHKGECCPPLMRRLK